MNTPDLRRVAAVVALAALLGACGSNGGDDDAPAPGASTGVPTSATDNVSGLIAYLNELIAGTSETSEPVRLGDVTLPVSDTTEPTSLN